MRKFYFLFQILFFLSYSSTNSVSAQLTATFTTYESRCAATGAIKIVATGGSGNYQYKVNGPINTNFTNQDSITGLSAGTYTVTVNDINTNQTYTKPGVVVGGTYADPRFSLSEIDVSCDNGSNGSITVQNLQNGRSPFVYSIVAPSPMGVGTSNSSGIFTGLEAGNYSIQLTDSCGGIQTRTVTINNYTWKINTYGFTKNSCTNVTGNITVTDSKGNNSGVAPIPGFSYGVVTQVGDTIWSPTGNFNINQAGIESLVAFARDSCGNIKKVNSTVSLVPSLDANASITNQVCKTFTASVTGITNFFAPQFCLFDNNNIQIGSCNSTGVFNNIPYGSYCIKAHDACTDSTIVRCFSPSAPVASLANNVVISNKICASFSASVTGQQNLTNPTYCILNSGGDTLGCNNTSQFDNLSYGSYCIITKDGCIDTVITRCFSAKRPTPRINPVITPSYITCTNFGLNIGGDTLTNPTYCLYDSNHVLVGSCNNSGIFDSIPLGNYCVNVHDACTDTTIIRCFNISHPIITNDVNISISNQNCTTFTATATSSNLSNPQFCLYRAVDSSLISCNTTGVFNGILYGNYYIKSTNPCPDTTFINSFSANRVLPTVNPNVQISNITCNTFSAQITGQQNLINPTYCLINTTTNDTLGCNNTGIANNIPYGSYLAQIVSGCNDTLRIPFSQSPPPLGLNMTAQKSCFYGTTKFNFNVTGTLPVNIQILTPGDSLVRNINFNANNFSIDSLPDLGGQSYTIIGTDNCGNKDTLNFAPIIGYLYHSPSVISECPGSVWPNGYGEIQTTISTNLGFTNVRIIEKNSVLLSSKLSPSSVSDSTYTFNNLGPGTYVIRYKANDGCGVNLYDTVTITPYQFPTLSKSAAYQCDNNGFSVGGVASGGVDPFSYQIFGSTPSVPSLVSPPQASPVFNINNGTTYSLIRLRALDACGNATLGDVSILPLADNRIISTSNCFLIPATLSVDTIYNATYSWFLKSTEDAKDSVAVSNGSNYFIPNVLPSDTGVYVCHISVNSGCINRTDYFHLDGSCYSPLDFYLTDFTGKFIDEKVQLKWSINNTNNLDKIIVERKTNTGFAEIGSMDPHLPSENNQYQFLDQSPAQQNFYRLKLIKKDNTFSYSNIIFLQSYVTSGITIYPNPATNILNINFYQTNNHTYRISLLNILNQKLKEIIFNTENGNKLQIKRTRNISGGIYILQFIDMNTNEEFSQKVIFNQK